MFLRAANPRSIASQLVLLFTLAAALLLCCGLGVFYLLVVRHAFEEDNEFLTDKVFALRADLRARPNALLDELETRRAGEHTTYWIRVIDPAGQVIAETPKMDQILPATVFKLQKDSSVAMLSKNYRIGGKLFSLLATNAQARGQTYTIQIAQDRSADVRFTREFGALLGLVAGLGIVASALIAINVTRRGLRPLGQMTHALRRVAPSHLNERVAPAGWPNELQPLAIAFDEMLDRLEDSFRRLSQFSGDLAHELRTPIANLLGEAQVSLTRDRTPQEYREVIESNVAECERLSGIIDNLLFLARADAASEQIQRVAFDARAAVEKIVMFHQAIAEEQGVEIEVSGRGDVFADRVFFEQALSNVLENALHFTPAGGTIQIEIVANEQQTVLTVADTGCGIGPEHLPRVFDRFYRVDGSRSSRGAGLGLALVKSILDLHGGSTVIKSELDRGTSVTLVFPAAGIEA